jgi:transposase, IS30 family
MAAHLTVEQRELAWRLKARGLGPSEIARQLGCSRVLVYHLNPEPKYPARPLGFEPGPGRLSLAEREEISLGLHSGLALRAIARRLGRSASTISREVAGSGGREHYRAYGAHLRAFACSRRPKVSKLANDELSGAVAALLEQWWSPRQISRHLKKVFSDDPMMQVSHETIYQSLFVQGRGELRKELARCLRTGRARRKTQGRIETRGRIKNMVMISARPAEVVDRAVPGHWEGDLLAGAGGKSHIATLVERSTRYVMLAKIPNAKAETVAGALSALVTRLPSELWRSLTWDQGAEMAAHELFSMTTGIPVYFCDPHSPWQRGSNENTNGLLRQYFPKGTSLRGYSQGDLDQAAISLNGRPRETLGWDTPAERLTALLVADTA